MLLTAAAVFVLQATRVATPSLDDDRAVTYLALRIFERDSDKLLSRDRGVFLINPRSLSVDEFPPSGNDEGCGGLQAFDASIASRNSTSTVLSGSVPASSVWRMATSKEVGKQLFDSGEARTMVSLLLPAYDEVGKNALVAVMFLDGVHFARANFHFSRTATGWAEECVDTQHWP